MDNNRKTSPIGINEREFNVNLKCKGKRERKHQEKSYS
jgi:hypothetical protein